MDGGLEKVDKEQSLAGRLRREELNDVRQILSTRSGRRFYWRMLSYCGVFTSSFTGNSKTFFLEGKREVGLLLMEELMEAKSEAYALMSKESQEDDGLNDQEKEA